MRFYGAASFSFAIFLPRHLSDSTPFPERCPPSAYKFAPVHRPKANAMTKKNIRITMPLSKTLAVDIAEAEIGRNVVKIGFHIV